MTEYEMSILVIIKTPNSVAQKNIKNNTTFVQFINNVSADIFRMLYCSGKNLLLYSIRVTYVRSCLLLTAQQQSDRIKGDGSAAFTFNC